MLIANTILVALSVASTLVSADPVAKRTISAYQNAAYFANWGIYARDYQPAQLPAEQLSYVLYSFAQVNNITGEVFSSDPYADTQKHYGGDATNVASGNNVFGCVKELYMLKKANRGLKVLLSIGGWAYSANMSTALNSDDKRAKFVSSAVALMKDWGMDGLDIDYEYPANPTDAANYVTILQNLRSAMDTYATAHTPGYHFMLTAASPASPTNYNNMPLSDMSKSLDFFNLMAYDYAGAWDTTSGHQANLYANSANTISTKFSTDKAVKDYIAAGVPARKIVLGMPIYGRSFLTTTGLGATYTGTGNGTWEKGIYDYKDLPKAGANVIQDLVAGATYSYDPATQELISYDTLESIYTKVQYLKNATLGGSMFWEASADRIDAQSLIAGSYAALGNVDTTQNLLSYPDSQYANMAAGMA